MEVKYEKYEDTQTDAYDHQQHNHDKFYYF